MRGDRVKSIREFHGITQEQLAEQIGVAVLQINRYENNKTEPNGETVGKIALALQVSADYLLGLTDDPVPAHGTGKLSVREWVIVSALRKGDYKEAIKVIVNDG